MCPHGSPLPLAWTPPPHPQTLAPGWPWLWPSPALPLPRPGSASSVFLLLPHRHIESKGANSKDSYLMPARLHAEPSPPGASDMSFCLVFCCHCVLLLPSLPGLHLSSAHTSAFPASRGHWLLLFTQIFIFTSSADSLPLV